jgi:hypothetical protein
MMALRRITTTTLLLLCVLSATTNYAFAFTTKSYSPLSTPREYQQKQQKHRIQKQQHCQQQFTLRAVFESSNNHERENNNDDIVPTNSSHTNNDITTSSTSPPFNNPTSPEEAIQNQLYYYQHNLLHMAYHTYCSPGNKAATGSYDEFVHLVNQPPYDLIVGHERADVLLELVDVKPPGETNYGMYGMIEDDDDDKDDEEDDGEEDDEEEEEEEGMIDNINGKVLNVACCLVCIRPNKKARSTYPVWFWWEMSLVEEEEVVNSSIATIPSTDDEWIGKSFELQTTTASTIDMVGGNSNNNKNNSVGNDNNNIVYDYDDFASSTITAISNDESSVDDTTQSQQQQQSRTSARWLVDCISPDFEDLDFETESLLSIEDFMNDDGDDGDDDDDEDGEYDDITIFLDY